MARFLRAGTASSGAIDASGQIRLFGKLKLENHARPGNRAGLLILERALPVAWVERFRETHGSRFNKLRVSSEAQPAGYGAIAAAAGGEAAIAPNPPSGARRHAPDAWLRRLQ